MSPRAQLVKGCLGGGLRCASASVLYQFISLMSMIDNVALHHVRKTVGLNQLLIYYNFKVVHL